MSTKIEGYLRIRNLAGEAQCFLGNPEDAQRLMIQLDPQLRNPQLTVDYVLVSTTTTHIGVWQNGNWLTGGQA